MTVIRAAWSADAVGAELKDRISKNHGGSCSKIDRQHEAGELMRHIMFLGSFTSAPGAMPMYPASVPLS